MPQYKDESRGSWYCKFYYTDWTGARKTKMKRGFPTKRKAAAWERDFLQRQQGSPDMTFQTLVDLYMEDMAPRLKESTVIHKRSIIDRRLLPYFKDKPIASITSANIRKWQVEIMNAVTGKGKPFSPGYVRSIDREMSAIFNYAVKHYDLPKNPHTQAGSIGKYAVRVQFWTLDEFNTLITLVDDIRYKTIFYTLYFTGLRIGELMALTVGDINFQAGTITISKTYHRIEGRDVVTSPKTEHSNRVITAPAFLLDILRDYIGHLYNPNLADRLFTVNSNSIKAALKKYAVLAAIS